MVGVSCSSPARGVPAAQDVLHVQSLAKAGPGSSGWTDRSGDTDVLRSPGQNDSKGEERQAHLRETEEDQQKYPVMRHVRLLAALHMQPLGITTTARAPLDTQATPN